jgi:hypothetical protein
VTKKNAMKRTKDSELGKYKTLRQIYLVFGLISLGIGLFGANYILIYELGLDSVKSTL